MVPDTEKVYILKHDKALGLPEAVSVFGFRVSLFGVFLMLGAVLGTILVFCECKRRKQDSDLYLKLLPLVLLVGVWTARLYYAAFQWYPFSEHPLELLNIRKGGLAYFGALLGIWAVVKGYTKRKDVNFYKTADVLCFGASAAAVPIWLGCIFTREPIGKYYEGVFSVKVGAQYLPKEASCEEINRLTRHFHIIEGKSYISMHPLPVYGMVFTILIFGILCAVKFCCKKDGALFFTYLVLNSIAILALECFRASKCMIWGTEIPVNCIVAVVLILAVPGKLILGARNRER